MKLPKFSDRTLIGSIFIANLALRLFRLNSPNFAYYDEQAFYLKAARSVLEGKGDPNYMHPPLSKELWALTIHFFGDNSFAWRGLQAVLASLAVVVVYLLAKKLFKSQRTALIAAFLLTVDFAWFTFSRVAVPEMIMVSLFVFSVYFLYLFWQTGKYLRLTLGAVLFGLALATKWTPLIFIPILLFILVKKYQEVVKVKVLVTAVFLIIAAGVYLGSFLLLPNNFSFKNLTSSQVKMLDYHFNKRKEELVKTNNDFLSQSRTVVLWPIYVYPLYAHQTGGNISTVVSLFNPVLVWGGLLATFFTLKKLFKSRKFNKEGFLAVGFLIFWLVWVVGPRNSYPYYWLIGMPFAAMLLAKFLTAKSKNYLGEVIVLLAASLALFAFFYPLLTNSTVPIWYLRLLTGISGVN